MADFEPGTFSWLDLTVDDAPGTRDFYEAVFGWTSDEVDMGGYSDFNMCGGKENAPVAGICISVVTILVGLSVANHQHP